MTRCLCFDVVFFHVATGDEMTNLIIRKPSIQASHASSISLSFSKRLLLTVFCVASYTVCINDTLLQTYFKYFQSAKNSPFVNHHHVLKTHLRYRSHWLHWLSCCEILPPGGVPRTTQRPKARTNPTNQGHLSYCI